MCSIVQFLACSTCHEPSTVVRPPCHARHMNITPHLAAQSAPTEQGQGRSRRVAADQSLPPAAAKRSVSRESHCQLPEHSLHDRSLLDRSLHDRFLHDRSLHDRSLPCWASLQAGLPSSSCKCYARMPPASWPTWPAEDLLLVRASPSSRSVGTLGVLLFLIDPPLSSS